jgi:hypothetical protein
MTTKRLPAVSPPAVPIKRRRPRMSAVLAMARLGCAASVGLPAGAYA